MHCMEADCRSVTVTGDNGASLHAEMIKIEENIDDTGWPLQEDGNMIAGLDSTADSRHLLDETKTSFQHWIVQIQVDCHQINFQMSIRLLINVIKYIL